MSEENRGKRVFTQEAENAQLAQIFGSGGGGVGGGGLPAGQVSGPFAPPGEEPGIFEKVGRGLGQVVVGRIAGPQIAQRLIPYPGGTQSQAVDNIELPGGRILQVAEDGSSRLLDVPGVFSVGAGNTVLTTSPEGDPRSSYTAETTKMQDALLGQRILDLTKPTDDPNRARIMATPEQVARGRMLLDASPDQYRLLPARKPGEMFNIVRKGTDDVVDQVFGDDPKLDDYLGSDEFEARPMSTGSTTNVNVTTKLMESSTKAGVEKGIIGQVELLNRLDSIERSFTPDFFQHVPRLSNWFARTKSRFGAPLTTEEKQQLEEFATLGQNVDENVSLFIKEITGAQMSEFEAKRLTAIQVNRDDDPVAAWTKLQNKIGAARVAVARQNILRKQGFTSDYWEQMSLHETQQFVDRRMSEMIVANQGAGMDDDSAFEAARAALKSEIGVDPQRILQVDEGSL